MNSDDERILTLASASPQRSRILTDTGFPFRVMPQDIDESFGAAGVADEVVRLAREKAESCLAGGNHSRWILGADTVVAVDGAVLGKPADRTEASAMLGRLQGRDHSVVSGVACIDCAAGRTETGVALTRVSFRRMSAAEIEAYLDTEEWRGAAGGYRIQGRGALFIHSLEGSYHNVVGLPIETIYGILRALNYPFP